MKISDVLKLPLTPVGDLPNSMRYDLPYIRAFCEALGGGIVTHPQFAASHLKHLFMVERRGVVYAPHYYVTGRCVIVLRNRHGRLLAIGSHWDNPRPEIDYVFPTDENSMDNPTVHRDVVLGEIKDILLQLDVSSPAGYVDLAATDALPPVGLFDATKWKLVDGSITGRQLPPLMSIAITNPHGIELERCVVFRDGDDIYIKTSQYAKTRTGTHLCENIDKALSDVDDFLRYVDGNLAKTRVGEGNVPYVEIGAYKTDQKLLRTCLMRYDAEGDRIRIPETDLDAQAEIHTDLERKFKEETLDKLKQLLS